MIASAPENTTHSDTLLTERITRLRKERNAVILAHNYQLPEVQDIADFVGDSLGLSQQAASTTADVIVFCGVHFMAETASILCPDKRVLIPDLEAGCSLVALATGATWRGDGVGRSRHLPLCRGPRLQQLLGAEDEQPRRSQRCGFARFRHSIQPSRRPRSKGGSPTRSGLGLFQNRTARRPRWTGYEWPSAVLRASRHANS